MLRRALTDYRLIRKETRQFLVASMLMGAAFSVPWTLLNLYLDRLGFSKAEIGTVQSAESWGRALIAIPAAFLLTRWRTTPLLVWTALGTAVAYFTLPWLPTLSMIFGVNLLRGFFDQVHHVAIAPFVFRHTSIVERAAAFGLAEAVHTLAAVVGSFGCGQAVDLLAPWLGDERLAMGWVLAAAGVLPLASAFVFARIREAPRDRRAREPILPLLRKHRGLIARFAIPQGVVALGAGLSIPFLGLYFQDRFHFGPGSVGTLNACGMLLMTTGYLFSPMLLRRLGFVKSMVACELLSIPFFLVLAFTYSMPLAIAAFLLRGALMNLSHPILKNFMMQAAPPNLRELQNGVLGLLWGVGWILGPIVGGRILVSTDNDYTPLMCTTVGIYLAASLATFTLLRRVERESIRPG
jgi:predicted MFS family arabinose efflux permease